MPSRALRPSLRMSWTNFDPFLLSIINPRILMKGTKRNACRFSCSVVISGLDVVVRPIESCLQTNLDLDFIRLDSIADRRTVLREKHSTNAIGSGENRSSMPEKIARLVSQRTRANQRDQTQVPQLPSSNTDWIETKASDRSDLE